MFGIPRALEQAPYRAVQAALAIQRLAADSRQRGRPLPQIRIGVHLGSMQFDTNAAELADGILPIDDAIALPHAQRLAAALRHQDVF